MTEELKLCPHCGSSYVNIEIEGNFYHIKCNVCETDSKYFCKSELAINFWNAHPLEDALLKRAEKAEAKVVELEAELDDPVRTGVCETCHDKCILEVSKLYGRIEKAEADLAKWKGIARNLADELGDANSKLFPVSWEDANETSPAWVAYCNLRDKEK